MKKIASILICSALVCAFLFGAVACGGRTVDENTLVIYTEYNGLSGRDDDAVKEAIEKKFEEDTGKKLTLSVEPHSTNTIGNKVTGAIGSGERLDAVITHYSSDSFITEMITGEKELKDLTALVPQYAPKFLERFNETSDATGSAYNKGMFNGKLYALSSIELNSIFGMLVNKTHMQQAGYDPDEYDIAKEGYKSFTISEFRQFLLALKEKVGDGKNRPLTGAPYDIEYFLLPVFESTGYTRMELVGDRLYPAWATENYCKVLEEERWLQEQKLWTDNPLGSSTAERDFLAGRASVYTPYPEVTQQIETARQLKKSLGDDCVMLAPLRADGEEESRGNLRHETAFCGMVVPKSGQNTELLLEYMNWLSVKENYELAKYGIKGVHWEEATTAAGHEAYKYPDAKRAEYEESAPYSGVHALLTDVALSNRVYAGYSEQESKWVEEVHSFQCYPAKGYDDEGVNMPSIPTKERELKRLFAKLSDEYVGVRAMAWSDVDLGGKSITSRHSELVAKLEDEYKLYIDFLTTEYNKIIQSFQK